MKLLSITKTNVKGQVVIPKEIRKKLNIDHTVPLSFEVHESMIIIKPVKQILVENSNKTSYLDTLLTLRGNWVEDPELEAKRRKAELKSAKEGKNAW